MWDRAEDRGAEAPLSGGARCRRRSQKRYKTAGSQQSARQKTLVRGTHVLTDLRDMHKLL